MLSVLLSQWISLVDSIPHSFKQWVDNLLPVTCTGHVCNTFSFHPNAFRACVMKVIFREDPSKFKKTDRWSEAYRLQACTSGLWSQSTKIERCKGCWGGGGFRGSWDCGGGWAALCSTSIRWYFERGLSEGKGSLGSVLEGGRRPDRGRRGHPKGKARMERAPPAWGQSWRLGLSVF